MLEHTDPGDPQLLIIGGREWWEFPNGRLLPVIRGAEDDPKPDDPKPDDPKPDDPKPDPDPDEDKLGDAGKRALEAERKARRDAEHARKAAEDELAKLRQQGESEQEKKVREAEDAARKDERTKAKRIALKGAVKSAAAGKFANPDLAIRLLDLEEFDVDDDGELTEPKKLTDAIEALLKENPGLAAGAKPPGKASGNGDGGGRKSSGSESEGFGLARLKGVDRSTSKRTA